jgi:hypothetical protein
MDSRQASSFLAGQALSPTQAPCHAEFRGKSRLVVQNGLAQRQVDLLEKLAEISEREFAQRDAGQEVDGEDLQQERAALAPESAELKEIRDAIEDKETQYVDNYIACLTEHGDQLSQWRGYAREGYCVGFDTKSLLKSIGEDRVIRRVHYYDESTNDQYASRMIWIAKSYRNLMLTQDDMDETFRRYVIMKQLLVDAAFMKDSNFAEEREVRIVEINGTPDLFTPHRYGMVPRSTVPIPPGAVKSVTVGPSAHEEIKQRSLRNYFIRVGFGGSELPPMAERVRPIVRRSSIPFRDW